MGKKETWWCKERGRSHGQGHANGGRVRTTRLRHGREAAGEREGWSHIPGSMAYGSWNGLQDAARRESRKNMAPD